MSDLWRKLWQGLNHFFTTPSGYQAAHTGSQFAYAQRIQKLPWLTGISADWLHSILIPIHPQVTSQWHWIIFITAATPHIFFPFLVTKILPATPPLSAENLLHSPRPEDTQEKMFQPSFVLLSTLTLLSGMFISPSPPLFGPTVVTVGPPLQHQNPLFLPYLTALLGLPKQWWKQIPLSCSWQPAGRPWVFSSSDTLY